MGVSSTRVGDHRGSARTVQSLSPRLSNHGRVNVLEMCMCACVCARVCVSACVYVHSTRNRVVKNGFSDNLQWAVRDLGSFSVLH